MAAGGLIALVRPEMLVGSATLVTEGTRIYAGYLVSRNLAIAALLLLTIAMNARRVLANLLLLTALIQFFDCVLDAQEGRWLLLPGITVLGCALLIASARASGSPFWKRSFWSV